jgi:hypothetical protein
MRTTRAGALALALALHLLGGLTPAVLCMHHDGNVAIERADRGGVRCDDARTPCVPTGLAGTGQDHCHDAAIAQPGLGQRVAGVAAPALARIVRPGVPGSWSMVRADRRAGSRTPSRRTVVLRV